MSDSPGSFYECFRVTGTWYSNYGVVRISTTEGAGNHVGPRREMYQSRGRFPCRSYK
jgi:hypothetical protein